MAGRSVFVRAAELEAAGRPFVVATVVAVRRPTSARPGASGLVHPDGAIEGWVGGAAPSRSSSARRFAPSPTASHDSCA